MESFFICVSAMIVVPSLAIGYTVDELKCEVCRSLVGEMEDIVSKVGSKALVKVGSHRLNEKGDLMSTVIPLVHSEAFLIEAMESACDRMENYARGYDKKTHRLRVVKMKLDNSLNPEMSEINPISDADLNESLRFYCEDITDEYEKDLVRVFKTEASNRVTALCTGETGLCQALQYLNEDL